MKPRQNPITAPVAAPLPSKITDILAILSKLICPIHKNGCTVISAHEFGKVVVES
jgi:hypothetical protein